MGWEGESGGGDNEMGGRRVGVGSGQWQGERDWRSVQNRGREKGREVQYRGEQA